MALAAFRLKKEERKGLPAGQKCLAGTLSAGDSGGCWSLQSPLYPPVREARRCRSSCHRADHRLPLAFLRKGSVGTPLPLPLPCPGSGRGTPVPDYRVPPARPPTRYCPFAGKVALARPMRSLHQLPAEGSPRPAVPLSFFLLSSLLGPRTVGLIRG